MGMKFRLNVGRHREVDKSKGMLKRGIFDPSTGKRVEITDGWPVREYGPGDVVESDFNLVRRFNSPGVLKFERVMDNIPPSPGRLIHAESEQIDESLDAAPPTAGVLPTWEQSPQVAAAQAAIATAPTVTSDTLKSMDLKELKAMAAEEEIPLGNAKTKEEIAALISAHFNG